MLPGTSAETWEQAILRMTSHHAPAGTLAHWLALRQAHPVSRSNALRQLMAAARFGAPAEPPPCPTLLLASLADQLVNVACSRALAQNWHCALQLHPSAGHDLPLDDAPWVIEQIRQWLAGGPENQPGTLFFHGSSTSATRR
jgi:pimeloyl-ACP methyl ester carboxylesterase